MTMTPTDYHALRAHIRDRLLHLREVQEARLNAAMDVLPPDEQAAQWAYDAWAQLLPLPDTNRWRDQD